MEGCERTIGTCRIHRGGFGLCILKWNERFGGLVAAAISSRSLSPRFTLTLASVAEFLGPFLFGTAVAATIGKNLIQFGAITIEALLVAVASALAWSIATSYLGLPSSSTHALLGGLVGAVAIQSGPQALVASGFAKVLLALFSAPILGMLTGYMLMKLSSILTRGASPHINWYFKRAQIFNVVALALSHGTNDGQKSMGLIALALMVQQKQDFVIPFWVTLLCAIALMLGVSTGGWRIIRTMGARIYRLRPVHATVTQTSATLVVLGAALIGAPVSTTQVVSTAIMGVGGAERMSGVRWGVAGQIVSTWFLTIPASALLAAVVEKSLIVENIIAVNMR